MMSSSREGYSSNRTGSSGLGRHTCRERQNLRRRTMIIIMIGVVTKFGVLVSAAASSQNTDAVAAAKHPSQYLRALTQRKQQHQQQQLCPTSNTFSLFTCADPFSSSNVITCDTSTCQWNLIELVPTFPPTLCQNVIIRNVNATDIPDLLKPCALWKIMFGNTSAAPTTAPQLSNLPSASPIVNLAPVSKAPKMAPITHMPVLPPVPPSMAPHKDITKTYSVSLNAIFLNLLLTSPLAVAKTAFSDPTTATVKELRLLTQRHILQQLSTNFAALYGSANTLRVLSVHCPFTTTSPTTTVSTPWQNATVVVTLSTTATVQFQSAVLGPPQPSAVQTMVEDCFREPIAVRGYVQSLQVDPDRILQRTKAVSLGLLATASSTTTDTTATSTTTTDDNGAASSSEQPKPESSRLVQWGDWNNLNFLVFVSVVGGVLLLWVLAASCDACRKRRQKRRDQAGFALVSHKKSGETEAIPSPTSTDDHNDPSFTKVGDKQKRTISLHKASSSAASETVDAILEQSSQADSCSVGAVMKPRMIDDSRAEYEGENSSLSASEAASIYSYIQSTVWGEEDNCYSVADGSALMHYNPHIPGVDEPSTTNWSVADGDVTTLTLENDYENVQLLPATTTTATPDEGKTSLEGSLSRIKSTGGGAVRSQNSNGDNGLFTTDGPSEVMIFCDGGTDEDTMSLISESMIVTALDYGHDRGFPVRKLSAAAGSQMTNKQQSDHRDGSVNASSNANNLDYSFAAQSTSSQLLGDEVNQSFADSSVSLTSYQVTPYAKERVLDPIDPDPMEAAPSQSATLVSALIEGNGNNRNGAAAGSEELSLEETQLPFRTRSRTTNSSVETGTSTNGDSSNLGGSRSSSSHKPPLSSFVLRSTSFKKPQGGAAPVQPVGVSNSKENNDDTNNITGFLTRSARISKASQVALHSGSSSRDSSSQRQSQASMATEIQGTVRSHFTLQSQVISTVEQDQESESDIQSICSNDDHSLFSFASKVERLSNHAAASPASRGSTFLSQQERSLLGAHPHDVPTTNDDEDNEGDYICLPADYN